MTKLFISYSRKDSGFARKLKGRLDAQKMDVWIDWHDIPPSRDWWDEIKNGIEEADVFVFLVSPDSVRSKVCGEEIAHAVKNGKRLIPIVVRNVTPNEALPDISKLNWIFFQEDDSFEQSFQKLDEAIHTDFEWVQAHRRLQVKALEWDRRNQENSYLLRGQDLKEAENQLATKVDKDPRPTELQRQYVLKSRYISDRQRKLLTSISIGVVLVLVGFFSFSYIQEAWSKRQARNLGDLVLIAGGPAILGDDELSKTGDALTAGQYDIPDFLIEKYEVTNKRYSLCVYVHKCDPSDSTSAIYSDGDPDNKPVTQVTIKQAIQFCTWIDRRLPSEMEWERAARFTDGRTWPWKEPFPSSSSYANLNYGARPADQVSVQHVGLAKLGISQDEPVYDLIGNAWELTCTPKEVPTICWNDQTIPSTYKSFIIRGAAANIPPSDLVVSAYRQTVDTILKTRFIGFRCVEDP